MRKYSHGEQYNCSLSEILTDPPLLFCDEPTTGLDSYNAKKLVKMMKEMAARRKTILCTIHQPSSEVFAMFDRLLLLAEGRIAFLGSSKEALEFFDSLNHKCPPTFNPADFYIHTLAVLPGHEVRSRDRIKRICNNFAVSTIKPLWIVELYWLLWRALLDSYRNPAMHSVRILQKIIPGFIVDPIAFCLICYWMVGLQQYAYQFFMTILIVIFTANVSSACGAMFSAIFESIPYIMLFLIPFDVVLLISGGLFINLQTLPPWISWVRYLSWFMYSNEALTVTQWTGVTNIRDQVIEEYSFSPKHLPMDFAFMISLYAIFHIIGYIGLRVRAKKK
ncbi:ABC transporter G family member 18 [Armadillidium nasatum]|uniref:ABC transporter G family member 18 n=1 Tax=Armadillidium nasatum TaxID=96803 RepID=A0A5N5SNJ4_9CRUS|nr:ABC transporter G family member 18 [Armadillidium nasatum]